MILLLGHTGKVGYAVYDKLWSYCDITGRSSESFDADNHSSVIDLIREHEPDVVINTVAYHNISLCEQFPNIAYRINTLYPKLLANLSNRYNFTLINYSTECVFGNRKTLPSEFARPTPNSIYSFTKYGGDLFVEKIAKKYYILRLPLVFGLNERNDQFIESSILGDKEELNIFSDVYTTPTYNKDIAKETVRIYEEEMDYGVYHITNKGRASFYDIFVELNKKLKLNLKLNKISAREFYDDDIKNMESGLITEKLYPLRGWKSAIKEFCEDIKNYDKSI